MALINTKIANVNVGDSYPIRTMGIINLSKESFYKKSFISPDRLSEQVKLMVDEGAVFLDLGARSTAPGVQPISVKEEKERWQKNWKNRFHLAASELQKMLPKSLNS